MDSRLGTPWFYEDQKVYEWGDPNFISGGGTDYTNYFDGSRSGYNSPRMHWYIRPNDQGASESYDDYCYRKYAETISASNGYTEIASTTDFYNLKTYTFSTAGSYDLIYTIDGVLPESAMNLGDEYANKYLQGMCVSQTKQLSPRGYTTSTGTASYTQAERRAEIDKLKPYRVEWNKITITERPTEAMLSKGTITVREALGKVLDVVNNQFYVKGDSVKSAPTFTLDQTIFKNGDGTDKYSNIECPEMTFEKGKSLWDALLEIGRLFGGIPRLLQGNIVSFDILKDMAHPINGNTDYAPDKNEPEEMESQITNHTTGYISQLSNMIPNGALSVFPSANLWITPRSQSESDPYVTRTNMSIVLDRNIFKIFDLRITNFNASNPGEELSLLPYVYEKSIFDTLNNDSDGKGLAIYWKKGDNKIYGLGIIPQANEMYAAWGWASDKYVIQNILSKLGYSNLSDVSSFKYKVWYIPYTDARVYTEHY